MSNERIRELLRKEMATKRLSQRRLAAKIKIPPASIGNYLDTDMQPNMKSLEAIAAYFRVPVSALLDDAPFVPAPPTSPSSDLSAKYISALERIIDLERQLQEARGSRLLTGDSAEASSDG